MQATVFQYQLAFFQRAPQVADQRFRAEWLFQKIIGTFAHCLYSHRHIAVAGQQNHGQVPVKGVQMGQQLQAGHARHAHIGQHHAREMLRYLRQTLFGASEDLHLET